MKQKRSWLVSAVAGRKGTLVSTALLLALACTMNPATGRRQLTLIGEQQEIAMGMQYDKSVVAEYGLYPDDGWQAYIDEIGSTLAAASERPELDWQFRVVDDATVNAFAVPGGFVYMTRGILAHFNSEAQLATVMGHEIGHVTARHSVEQISRAQLAQLGLGVAMIASEDVRQYAGLAQMGVGVLFLKFSRDDERQSDGLGLRYLLRAGYDPEEAPRVFEMLDRNSEVQGHSRLPEWQATHPSPDRRVANLERKISKLPPEQREGIVKRNEYVSRLDGMTFGKDPRQGYAVGSTFYHPDMRFRMDFPDQWTIINQRQQVVGINADQNAVVLLGLAEESTPQEAARAFFAQEGVKRGPVWRRGYHQFEVTPQPDAAGNVADPIRGTVGFVAHEGHVFRLLCYTAKARWSALGNRMQRSIVSFRRLANRKYLDVHAKSIRIATLGRDQTLRQFNERHPSTIDLDRLAVLNGVEADEKLARGTLVKRVVGADPPAN